MLEGFWFLAGDESYYSQVIIIMDAHDKSTGGLPAVSFSSLPSTNSTTPAFAKASPTGTTNLCGGKSGRATVTPSPVGQSTTASSSSRVEVPDSIAAQPSSHSSVPKRLHSYQEYLSLVNDLSNGRAAGISAPMASKAADSKHPLSGTSQASTGATGAFVDGDQLGVDTTIPAASVLNAKVLPAVTAPKDSSPPKSDWRMAIDLSSFRPYYYHVITKEVTWENPVADSTGKNSDPGIWVEAVDESTGRFYYYHTVTGQVTWANPFAVAQQDSLKKLMRQISRSVPHGTLLGSDPSKHIAITPFRGISSVGASGKWKAETSVLGKNKKIGVFENSAAASNAYQVVRAALDRSELPPNDPIRVDIFEAARNEARNNAMALGCLEVSKPGENSPGNKSVNTKGFHQIKSTGNWCAQITLKGKTQQIGTFLSSEEASRAYALVSKALDDSGLSRQDDEALEVLKKVRDQVRRKTSVGVKGVSQVKSTGNWQAQISVKGLMRYIGTFPSSEEAAQAYASVKKALDESELSRQDDDALNVFQKAKDTARAELQRATTGIYQVKDSGNQQARITMKSKPQNIGIFPSAKEASCAFAMVEKALDESGASRQDDEAVEDFKNAKDQARRINLVETKGVDQTASGNWRAQISVKGKPRNIGTFPTFEEASHAYALVEKALDESGLSRQDDEALEVFQKTRDQARASLSVKQLPRGVRENPFGKFEARGSKISGKDCYIGSFNTAGEALIAVEVFANERQGIMKSKDEKELSLKIQAAKSKAKAAAIASVFSRGPEMPVATVGSKRKASSDLSSEREKKKSGVPNNSHENVSEQSKATVATVTHSQCGIPGCTRQVSPFSKGLCAMHCPRGPGGKW